MSSVVPRDEARPASSGDRERARLGIGLAMASAGFVCTWVLSSAQDSPAATLATWVFGIALLVIALVAFARNGSHAGWFHPLSLPFAAITVMSLGAPLWIDFTRQTTGLLYAAGHQSDGASPLAVTVSIAACEALTLVLLGYLAGTGTTLALFKQARSAATDQQPPKFRYRDLRHAGLALMATGAILQLTALILTISTPYGMNQLKYALPSILGPGAAASLFSGLIVVTVAGPHLTKPTCLRNLLLGSEWTALLTYFGATALRGGRSSLIAPAAYLAWAYSTQVRAIAFRSIVAVALLALISASAIVNYRQHNGLWPGSPALILRNAAGGMSSPAWLTEETIINVPSTQGYLHGSTYLAAAQGQLPGPISRSVGAPARTASAVFREIINFANPNQGFSESYPSEAYLNFGLAGCLGAGLFLGALMGWAWRKCQVTATKALDLLYPVILAGLIYGFRSDALTQIKDVLYPMLVVWAVMRFYRLRVTASPRYVSPH